MAAFVGGCYRPYLLCPVCKKTRWNLGAHLRRRCMRGRSASEVLREVEMEKMTAQDLLMDGRVWDYGLIRRIMDQPDPIRCFMAQLKDRGNVVVNIPPEAIPPLILIPPAVGVAESESDSDSESSGPDMRKRESVNQQQETASGSDSEEPSSVQSRKKRKRQEEEEEEEEITTDDEEEEDEDYEYSTWTFSSRMMDDEEEDEEEDEEDDEESSWTPRTSSSRTPGDEEEEEDDKKSRSTSRTFTSRMTDDEKHLTEGRLTSCSENAEMHYCMQEFGNVVAASVLLKRLTTHSYEQEDNTTDSAPENREQQAAYEKLLEACPITVGGALPTGRMLTELTGAHERYCSERWLIDQRQLRAKKILLEYLK